MLHSFFERLFRIREDENHEKPFWEHVEDLRWMLMKSFAVLFVAMILAFCFRVQLTALVQQPLAAVGEETIVNLQSLAPADSITISFRLAFYAGLVLAFPLLLFFALEFILPGLTPRERRMIFPALGIGSLLFLAGVLFSYYIVLPITLSFFFHDAQSLGWHSSWTVQEYFGFVTHFTIAFGLCFELPVAVMFLVRIGVLSPATLRATRSYAVVVIFVLAAIITPTTDVLTLFCMAGPMLILYEVSIWIAVLMEKREQEANTPTMD